jgi:ketosteroid isomerase-like protein
MSQENVEVVRRFFEEWVNSDPRREESWREASTYLDPDFEYREDAAWPGAGTHRGIPAFRQVVSGYSQAFAEMRLEAEEIFDAGDRVLALICWAARGQHGADAVMHQAGIFTVRRGRVASWQVFFDPSEALKAVGLEE